MSHDEPSNANSISVLPYPNFLAKVLLLLSIRMDVFDGHSLMTKTILYDDAKYGLQGPGLAKIAAYAANNAAFKSQVSILFQYLLTTTTIVVGG